jgi:pSer/pThr/pTyr-binding forkhead associated (FHA) protein
VSSPAEAVAVAAPVGEPIPEGSQVKLIVVRGVKLNIEYPVYEGTNFIGRSDEKPVDIDLDDQERADNIWSSRQHAVVYLENNTLGVEDLNSANGTYVNRERVLPGQRTMLKKDDCIQIGGIHLKVTY